MPVERDLDDGLTLPGDPKPNPLRPPETSNRFLVPTGLMAACLGSIGVGLRQLFRGLRNK